MSSLYTATPEPTADGSNQTEVARALKQTSEALIRKTEELEAAVQELKAAVNTAPPEDPASIITGSTSSAGGGGLTPTDAVVDPILDRAVEQANALVRQAQAETRTVIAALQTALDNFKAGYEDTNAVVNATISELTAQVGENTAAITEEELVRATTTQALAGRVSKITSVMNSNSAAITTEAVTRANADSALAAQITTVQTQTNNNTAAITAETIARTNADSALSSQITTVSAKADNATANGFYRLTAVASPTNGALAEFAVEVRATSTGSYAAAGMNIQAFSGGNRRIKFNTDQFIVTTGPDAYVPFAISGGNVYANDLIVGNANIENGAITSAKIGTAEVETLKIAGNAVTVPAAYIYGPIIYGNGSLQLIANLSFTMPYAGDALISFFGTHVYATAFPYATYFLDFYLDGTVIGGVYNGSTYPEVGVVFSTLRALSAGSHNIQVYWNGSNGTIGIGNIALSSVGAMR